MKLLLIPSVKIYSPENNWMNLLIWSKLRSFLWKRDATLLNRSLKVLIRVRKGLTKELWAFQERRLKSKELLWWSRLFNRVAPVLSLRQISYLELKLITNSSKKSIEISVVISKLAKQKLHRTRKIQRTLCWKIQRPLWGRILRSLAQSSTSSSRQ